MSNSLLRLADVPRRARPSFFEKLILNWIQEKLYH